MKKIGIVILFFLGSFSYQLNAQQPGSKSPDKIAPKPAPSANRSAHKSLRAGDGAYQKQDFPAAEESYRRALEKENSAKGNYNLGNTTYKQERYDEALKHYESAAESAPTPAAKAKAYHNLGNALYQKKDFQNSVEAYKNALRLTPDDLDTKKNLMLAKRQLQAQQQQQQQENKQDKNKKQQQKDQQDKKEQEQKDQQQQQQQQNQQNPNQSETPQDLSKQEAQELLDIMNQEEQKVQQKLRRAQAKGKSKKDW